uniref:Uncharacterized protein n=1 Tax=Pseudo-nitzschia delicatissima TaxID=44447 RepID=A0A7S0UMJ2_9STRA|mmetsp:Transcript_4401/g.9183  ORF Transcript_4401/g.9183 Transcript_4401/m.9183 type:complete len:682 (+) Transcript_4401:42-2087(+)
MKMSALTFDEFFEAAVGISSVVMVLSGCWIVRVLIQIEKTKTVDIASVLEDDGTGDDLAFTEETTEKKLEVEHADGSPSEIEMSPTGKSKETSPASSPTAKPIAARKARVRARRVSCDFIILQIVSVLVLILLTYLILVQSNANVFLRGLGSICVFCVFLGLQIGEEFRRQRLDRLVLLLSLFLLIASMLSTLVYSMKNLKQGEIYEGPARIVGYSMERYNNTMHDPTTRTDMAVSWGKDWGCPLSGGKVCQANVHGAMCQTHPEKEQTKHKPNYGTRLLKETEEDEKDEEAEEVEEALEEDLEDEEKDNQELEDENESLSAENEKLEEEIKELKQEDEVEEEENDELVEQENSEMYEIADEYDEDILIIEEEEEEDAQAYEDFEFEEDEDKLEDEIAAATDDEKKEELEEDLEEDQIEENDIDEEYEEVYDEYDEYVDEYEELAEEDYEDFEEAQDETIELEDEKDDLKEEVEETEEEIEEGDYSVPIDSEYSKGEGKESSTDEFEDTTGTEEYYEEEEAIEEAFEEDEYDEATEEELEEEFEEEWYWDEYPSSYDDDMYQDEYWNYDWDSVWGDYSCEDLFDADISGQTYDPNKPAGGDDEWPFAYIYGSCKTCDAYILNSFAEMNFEDTQEYKQQAIVYLAGAAAGLVWSLLAYVKYKVMPTEENEIDLLASDGGVLA